MRACKAGDYGTADSVLRQALSGGTDQDKLVARFFLALMMVKGQGPVHDEAGGTALMQAAAEGGLADAQNYMAAWYRKGAYGLKPDEAQSVSWSLQAARQGYKNAQYRVALAYQKGIGMRAPDLPEAYRWAVIAQSGGEPEAARLRSDLEKSISAERAAQLRGDAAQWLAQAHTAHPLSIYTLTRMSPDD